MSDDENVAGLSLEGLARELKSLRSLQRIAAVPKERVVGKFTGESADLCEGLSGTGQGSMGGAGVSEGSR